MHRDDLLTAHADARCRAAPGRARPRIGIGGPVGSGKTALVAALCRALRDELSTGRGHQRHLHDRGRRLPAPRTGCCPTSASSRCETGCCPHTAIRDDISANLDAVEDLEPATTARPGAGGERRRQPDRHVQPRRWSTRQIFVIDVAGGDKVPRKGGPGVTRSDLLVDQQDRPGAAGRRRPRRDARGTPRGCARTGRRCWCRCASSRTPGRSPSGSPGRSRRGAREERDPPRHPGTVDGRGCAGRHESAVVAGLAGDRATGERVHLVHGAGGPLGGDAFAPRAEVGPARRLGCAARGATLVQPGRGGRDGRRGGR